MTEKTRIKKAKQILKEIISICYESDAVNLHEEIVSIERGIKVEPETFEEISTVIEEIKSSIEIFSDDIDHDDYYKIEELFLEFLEMED